ncbi:MAG: hypothetical protein GF417_13945 [Candidatus Latescibacteria bacterium]|nr:hypothetical protein [bacterium]MBD3425532.1 hypothetical protein [Candidatus Latescibacterota bacterium]
MKNREEQLLNWIKIGIVSGLATSVIYPSLIFVPLPSLIQVFFIMAFGPALSLASAGIYFYLKLDTDRITNRIALVANIIAGTMISTMLLVQSAIRHSKPDLVSETQKWVWYSVNHVHYGLDVAWDLYIFLGTLFFAIAMFNHPKLGKLFSVTGIALSIVMIILNAMSFPEPPAGSGLFDLGPFIGLWYLAVTIRILTTYKSYARKVIG